MGTPLSTKQLAKQLGLLKRSSSRIPSLKTDNGNSKHIKKEQIFSHLLVLDFESTCWKDKEKAYSPEVIEFPAVLVNLITGEIVDEFQQYVQPTEHSKLSPFCTELTGIQQETVDKGVPIGVCLRLFTEWLHKLISDRKLSFPSVSPQPPGNTKAIFVTWSDWDLNTCLQHECKRKGITYSPYMKSWIDLRKTYQTFYGRRPKGLNGALKDLGIKFQGREHSGIDDAKNTALLAIRMVKDGCVMRATKSLILSTDVCNRYNNIPLLKHDVGLETTGNQTESSNSKQSPLYNTTPTNALKGVITSNNATFKKSIRLDTPECEAPPSSSSRVSIGLTNNRTPLSVVNKTSHPDTKLTITSPLCDCGRRCKRKKVVNPGPNTGRVFFSCPLQRERSCRYFKWESEATKPQLLLPKQNVAGPSVHVERGGGKQNVLRKHYQHLFNNC